MLLLHYFKQGCWFAGVVCSCISGRPWLKLLAAASMKLSLSDRLSSSWRIAFALRNEHQLRMGNQNAPQDLIYSFTSCSNVYCLPVCYVGLIMSNFMTAECVEIWDFLLDIILPCSTQQIAKLVSQNTIPIIL